MKKIRGKQWYSLSEVVREQRIPMARHHRTIKGYIERGYLKAKRLGAGKQARYFIREDWIEEFLDQQKGGGRK